MRNTSVACDKELRKRIKELGVLHEVSKAITSPIELDELLNLTLAKCMEVLESRAGSIFLVDEIANEMVLKAVKGPKEKIIRDVKQKIGEGIAGFVATTRQPLLVTDIENNPDFRKNPDVADVYETGSFLCVPLVSKEKKLVGVINITEKVSRESYTNDDLRFLSSIASYASIAIEKAELYGRLKRFNEELAKEVDLATSQLRRTNEDLCSLKEYNESIVSSILHCVIAIDSNWVVRTWNRCVERQLGISESEAVGRHLLELFPEWEKKDLASEIGGVLKRGVTFERENIRHKGKNGRPQMLNMKVSALYTSSGKIRGAVLIITDITEKIELQKQLLFSERLALIGRLSAGVAHELNNPLDGVIRYVNLSMDHVIEAELVQEYLRSAKEGLNRMASIIKSLLEFSRQTRAALEPTDVNQTVNDTVSFLHHQIVGQNVKIVKNLSSDVPIIQDGELQQVFANILKNAIDAMPEGGTIWISTAVKDDNIEIKFEDTGCGIPEEIMDNIFDPFFTTKEVGKGTGLGLTICYGIIEKYKGRIEVDSKIGKGTCFTVYLPVS
jgi:PAS domain S-box-containing protein